MIGNKYLLINFFLLLTLLLFGNNSYLYDQDEAAYAGFSRVMLETRDFVNIEFPFSTPHRKPPLHFWLTSLMFWWFGESEFVLRFLPSLWIFLTCWLTFKLAQKFFHEKTALLAFFILAFSLYFPLNGKIALVDSLLTFLQVWSFYLLYIYLFEENSKVLYIFWIPLALGALTKGPPIYIFVLGNLFLYSLHPYFRRKVFNIKLFLNLFLSFVPLLVWGYLAWKRTNGELILWMIDWYVLRRATNPVFGQYGPPGVYLLLFFITFFPWSIYIPTLLKSFYLQTKSLFSQLREKNLSSFEPLTYFLLSGLVFSWIFYEFMMSKLPSYVLASYPIFAILIAKIVEEKSKKTILVLVVINLVFVVLIQIVLFLFQEKRKDTFQTSLKWKEFLSEEEVLYFDKDYGIPSLAFYLGYPKQKIIVLSNIIEIKNLSKNSKLTLEQNSLLFLQQLRKFKVLEESNIFLYDRWKENKFYLVELED